MIIIYFLRMYFDNIIICIFIHQNKLIMEKKSPHILGASSNLLGFCLIILTSLEITKISNRTYIDEIAGIASLCLSASCFLSFLSIRSTKEKYAINYEKYADYFFVFALFCISASVFLVTLNFM